MRCRLCGKKAIYKELRFCEEHFTSYFDKKVKKVLSNPLFKDKKLLVALSGGKDSSALLFSLAKLVENEEIDFSLKKVEALYIELGISGYSESNLKASKELCNSLSINLNVVNLSDENGVSVDSVSKKSRKVCSECGVLKRYLINRFAFENGFDFVLTGHNIDDELFFAFHNLINGNLNYLARSGKITPTDNEKKLVGRVKPLYYISEKETAIYCLINNVPFSREKCPYSKNNAQIEMKSKIPLLLDSKSKKISFLKHLNKLKKYFPLEEENSVEKCERCGFPTTTKICKFCRIIEKNK